MKHIEDISRFIRLLHASKKFHVLTIIGPPGWGKSHSVRQQLNQLAVPYVYLGAYSTPLGLYNAICDSPGKTFVLDDTEGLLSNPLGMSLLNSASWPGADGCEERVLAWTSSSDKPKQPKVTFSGKIIAVTNHLPSSPQARAFINRSLRYEIKLDGKSIAGLLSEAAESDEHFPDREIAKSVGEFLIQLAHRGQAQQVSLRTLELGYEFAQHSPDHWQEMLQQSIPQPSVATIIQDLNRPNKKLEQQYQEFRRLTGKSRRTFFYNRKKYCDRFTAASD